ncbi:MAG: nitronate monooxygenase, partial [Alphaproteobacteria bacterium]|nr:nitronate monooxygenase [Alphaproteobacteria bacterium]
MIKVPKLLADKWKKGTDFLGTELAIIGGAMSWISEHNLVAAISESGGFGTLAGGALSAKELREEIRKTKELTQKPFGVNIIVMHPEIEELIDTCLEEKVTHIVLAAGIPSVNIIKRIKDGGAKSIAFAPALVIAKKLVKNGIDAIIIEGMEAGGHVGAVSTMVLAQEILPHVKEVPVFVAGGIGRGEAIIASRVLGASGVQL